MAELLREGGCCPATFPRTRRLHSKHRSPTAEETGNGYAEKGAERRAKLRAENKRVPVMHVQHEDRQRQRSHCLLLRTLT